MWAAAGFPSGIKSSAMIGDHGDGDWQTRTALGKFVLQQFALAALCKR